MKRLPFTNDPALLRTDFASERTWKSIKRKILGQKDEDDAVVTIIDDDAFAGLKGSQISAAIAKQYRHTFVMVADARSMVEKAHPILVIDLWQSREVELRVTPEQVESVAANLEIANADIDDFLRAADVNGIYRGDRDSPAG